MSAYDDYQAGGEASYTGSYVDTGTAFGATSDDLKDWGKMSTYTPAPQGARDQNAWWQNLVSYGVSRAIDNSLPNQHNGIQGNTNPGSFAGQNGRTYNQVGGVNAPPTLSGIVASVERINPIVLAAIGVAAYLLLKK